MIKPKDIVTVIIEENLSGCQGQVVKIIAEGIEEDGTIGVRFGKEYSYQWGADFDPKNIIFFKPGELRKDSDWTLESKAKRTFGKHMWHSLCTLKVLALRMNVIPRHAQIKPLVATLLTFGEPCMKSIYAASTKKNMVGNAWMNSLGKQTRKQLHNY